MQETIKFLHYSKLNHFILLSKNSTMKCIELSHFFNCEGGEIARIMNWKFRPLILIISALSFSALGHNPIILTLSK